MKIQKYIMAGALGAVALALACLAPRAQAQTIITNTFTFTFATTGPTEAPFPTTWNQWYSTYNNVQATCDPTTGPSSPIVGANTTDYGSMEVISPLAGSTQNLFFGTFASNINNSYDFSVEANTLVYSNVSFDILVAPGQPLSGSGDYGSIGVGFISSGYGYEQITGGGVRIPASASTSWAHLSVPLDQTQGFGNVPGICFDLNSYGYDATLGHNYPLFTITDWFANISLVGSTAPPPPPPTMLPPQTPIVGLNVLNTSPAANNNRYQIMTTNGTGCSFYGQGSPVTYSWTIKEFPLQDAYSYQAHFFIVNGSDSTNSSTYIVPGQYDTAADYNMQNCIFITVQSDGATNGTMNFRYKTNQIGGNGMIWNTLTNGDPGNTNNWPVEPVASLTDSNPTNNSLLGTWSVTFSGNTSVTLTGPGGHSTNFTFDAASAAMFDGGLGPVSLLLGTQANTAGYNGQEVVYSSFSETGNCAFSDNFLTNTSLNTNEWLDFGSDPAAVVLVPTGSAYWVPWTLPANSFSLYVASSLPATHWQGLSSAPVIKNGPVDQALVASSSLPDNGTTSGFFTVISNTYSQMLVLLPGQTFTPGVSPGYSGSPTALTGGDGGFVEEDVTVQAVDNNFDPISGVTDTINVLSSTDGEATLPNQENMVNGAVTFNSGNSAFYFQEAGTFTITVQDMTNTNIPNATSQPVVVGH